MYKHTTNMILAGIALAATCFTTTAATRVFSNTAPIGIADNSAATLYPSPINVSGLTGSIDSVNVTLHGFSHTWIGDLNVLLVSPAGQKIRLMQRAGSATPTSVGFGNNFANAEVTFSASAASTIPGTPAVLPASGSYLPTIGLNVQNSPFPAPIGPYGSNLTALAGAASAQNGTWNLFVSDHEVSDVGSIALGWSVSITGFFSCTDEGFTGAKRTLCHQVCEINYPPTTLNGLIKLWVALYHSNPPCVD